jgi:mannose-1-phosphate guanylyltransferase
VEAILLVGGRGTRLAPLTDHTPKPLLPVAGVPFIAHQLAKARDAGVTRVILACGYRSEAFTDWLADRSRHGLDVEVVVEDSPLGTGGAIRHAAERLGSAGSDPIVVLNGDVLSGHDLEAQLALHQERGAEVTFHLVGVEDARAFGCVPTAESGRVLAFVEKSEDPPTDQINAGCYVFRRGVIDEIPTDQPVSVEREIFPAMLARHGLLLGFRDDAYWLDLGTPAAYIRGSRDTVLGRLRSRAMPGSPGESLVMPGADVAATARVAGGSCVMPGAWVGEDAVVEGSILLPGSSVGSGAVVRDCAVLWDATAGAGEVFEGAVVE